MYHPELKLTVTANRETDEILSNIFKVLPMRSKKVADIMMLVPQLKMVAVATALPLIPVGKISVSISHPTKKICVDIKFC